MPDTQISEEMVERAARGICVSAGDDPDQKTYAREMACTGNDREPKLRWEFWACHARAALEAALSGHVVVTRIPTDTMLKAGFKQLGWTKNTENARSDAMEVYRAMIQAAPPVQEMEG